MIKILVLMCFEAIKRGAMTQHMAELQASRVHKQNTQDIWSGPPWSEALSTLRNNFELECLL